MAEVNFKIVLSCATAKAVGRHVEHMHRLHRTGYINDDNLEHWSEYSNERIAKILNAKGAIRVERRM